MTRTVHVIQAVEVTLDLDKFTPEFMEAFRKDFYSFDTITDHIAHLAQLAARGVISTPCFIEGYGPSEKMGISIQVGDTEEELGPVRA